MLVMRISVKFASLLLLLLVGPCLSSLPGEVRAQGVGRGPIAAPRDPKLEQESAHSLEVARYYFYKRKPEKGDLDGMERLNKAVESRLLEILDLNPNFGKVDEVYFLLGEVYLRWNNPDEAVKNFSRVVKDYPDSDLVGDSKKRLTEIESKAKAKKED
jgi:outer membrane protein assembly factor BamD (BamD/ComL family)